LSSSNPGAATLTAINGGPSESWTITVPEQRAEIAIWQDPGAGRLRFALQDAQRVAPGAIVVNASSGQNQTVPLYEWRFQAIDDLGTATTISGTRRRDLLVFTYGWSRPDRALTTETCTWQFTKQAATQISSAAPGGVSGRIAGAGTDAGLGRTGGVPTSAAPEGVSGRIAGTGAVGALGRGSNSPPVEGNTASSDVPLLTALNECPGPGLTIPPEGVAVTPGKVYFRMAGLPIGCSRCTGIPPFPQGGSIQYFVDFTIFRNDRSAPVATTDKDFADMRMSMNYGTSYIFTIIGRPFHYDWNYYPPRRFADACKSATVTLTPPRPATPAIVSAESAGAGVTIRWTKSASQFEDGYLVLGPGLPTEGRETTNDAFFCGCSIFIGGLPSGTHTWLVTAYWNTSEGRVIDVSTGARATATVR